MIGERENIYQDTNYGTLEMRAFDIDGNQINAFYDAKGNLVFVLDNTINSQKPNVLLVINPVADKKWDEILADDYGVDLETIRPKVDNKYQKLDIEYSGLPVYENLIDSYNAGVDLTEHLNQLAVLRDSAVRHSAVTRLNAANEAISKTNATIVKTKETIVRLEVRIKTLRSNLSAEKKQIGKVNTKQSASKILKLESQIEATNEKLKRAKKRLESAQKRLEIATVDAELASALLNQPAIEIKETVKSKPVAVAPTYPVQVTAAKEEIETDDDIDDNKEDDDNDYEEVAEDEVIETDVKPLFSEDPQILNDSIAFKPIEFSAPVFEEKKEETNTDIVPVAESVPVAEKEQNLESRPVLESFRPIEVPTFVPEPLAEEKTEIIKTVEEPEDRSVLDSIVPVPEDFSIEPFEQSEPEEVIDMTVTQNDPVKPVEPVEPITPVINTFQKPVAVKPEKSYRPGFIYYVLLLILIALSVFTLWLYQKNMTTDATPVLVAPAQETTVMQPKRKTTEPVAKPVVVDDAEPVFLDEEKDESETVLDEKVIEEPQEEIEYDENVIEEPVIEKAPVVMDVVPGRLNTSGTDEEEEMVTISEEDILASKPVFEPGAKHDNMFVNEEDYAEADVDAGGDIQEPGFIEPDEYSEYDGYPFDEEFDEEEAAYQAEMGNL